MGYGYLFVGLMFFINPNVNIIDILPDVFGCIFILIGLKKLSDVDGRFYNARTCAYYMLAVYSIKLLLSFYIPTYSPTNTLPFTFIFSVLDAILLITFFTNLYGGIEYTAERHGAEKELNYSNTASVTAFLFIVVKDVLAFLPESMDLFNKKKDLDLSYNAGTKMDIDYKPFVLILCVIASIMMGIVFAVVTGKYLFSLRKNKVYNDNLQQIYQTDILNNQTLLLRRRLKLTFILLLAGIAFMFDFTIDGINILPDFVGYLFLLFAYWTIVKQYSKKMPAKWLAVLLMVVSIFSYLFKTVMNFGVNRILETDSFFAFRVPMLEAGTAIIPAILITVIENVLFVILFVKIIRAVTDLPEVYQNIDKNVAVTVSAISGTVFAVLSSAVYVMPILTAFFRFQKSNAASNMCDNVHSVLGLFLILTTAWLLWYALRLKRRIEFIV